MSESRFAGTIALITGGSSGIGLSINSFSTMNGHDWAHLYRGLVSCFVFQKSSTRSARVTGNPSVIR